MKESENSPQLKTDSTKPKTKSKTPLGERFRGFLPVVVDLETGGFNAETDALLEMAIIILNMDSEGTIYVDHQEHASSI